MKNIVLNGSFNVLVDVILDVDSELDFDFDLRLNLHLDLMLGLHLVFGFCSVCRTGFGCWRESGY